MNNLQPCAIAYINSDGTCEQIEWLPSSLTSDPDCTLLVRDKDALAVIERLEAALTEVQAKYHELLYHVERKFDGESRHDTARRYIREAESRPSAAGHAQEGEK